MQIPPYFEALNRCFCLIQRDRILAEQRRIRHRWKQADKKSAFIFSGNYFKRNKMKIFDKPFLEIVLDLILIFIVVALCAYFNPLNF